MKTFTALGFGALLFLHLGTLASAAEEGRMRYSCVSDEGHSVLIENTIPGKKSFVFRVNGLLSTTAACLSNGAQAAPKWDSYPQTKATLSKNDPNYIVYHFSTKLLLEACDMDHVYRAPTPIFFGVARPMNMDTPSFGGLGGGMMSERPPYGAHVEYSDSCYHDVTNDVLVDVVNPLDSEIIMRNTIGETISRKPLKCYAGYPDPVAIKIEESAKVHFAQACGQKGSKSSSIEESGTPKAAATASAAPQSAQAGSSTVAAQ